MRREPAPPANKVSPIVESGAVVIAGNGETMAFAADTGQALWHGQFAAPAHWAGETANAILLIPPCFS
jgi:hypothetical protein